MVLNIRQTRTDDATDDGGGVVEIYECHFKLLLRFYFIISICFHCALIPFLSLQAFLFYRL